MSKINIHETVNFLRILGVEDEILLFQALDDSKRGIPGLTKTISGKFNDVLNELTDYSNRGAGIFLTINLDNGQEERKTQNIIGIRSFFADKDDGNFEKLPLPPTCINQSKNGQHAYWVLKSPSEQIDKFKKIQKDIADFLNTDSAICDLPRVMRLPGFPHQKDIEDPFYVKIFESNEDCLYDLEEIEKTFSKNNSNVPDEVRLKFLAKNTKSFLGGKFKEGQWNNSLFKAAIDFHEQGLTEEHFIDLLSKTAPYGYLDNSDLSTIKSAFSRNPKYPPRDSRHHLNDNDKVSDLLKGFYYVYLDQTRGGMVYLKHDPEKKTYAKISKEYLQHIIVQAFKAEGKTITKLKSERLIDTWALAIDHFKELPRALAVNDDPARAFNRIYINLEDTKTPYWDHIMSNIDCNAEALQAFIWSIFESDSEGQQYLWMYGQGGDGKGSILRLINKIIGDDAFEGLNGKDNHWLASCVGKRVGVFNDLTNTHLPLSSNFKQLTGGDKVPITNKYEKAYSAYLDTKLIITTNKNIMISSQESDLRRCIFVRFRKDDTFLEDFEETLFNERNGILLKCKDAYEKLVDRNGKIQCDLNAIEDESSSFEIDFEVVLNNDLEFCEGECVPKYKLYDFLRIKYGWDKTKYTEFKNWLIRQICQITGLEVIESRRRVNGSLVYGFFNIKMRGVHASF